ncbi:aspartate carbamoyltransferase [Candidatus Pacearchaeota archaeon]|nr:aspartate carbamoyltransferase [Candidatus Pacearchaeota archaeon]
MVLMHFIESQQLDKESIFDIFDKADKIRENKFVEPILNGKLLATLFYEPSTRTRLSFEAAMLKLGGGVITTENAKEFSSTIKGESLEDSIRVVSSYVDVIVLRHHDEGGAKIAASISKVPIINAGDGKGQHPTQALIDVYTIYKEIGRLENLKIAMVGDLASGRTVRSLCYLLGKFPGNEIIFVSPEHLKMKNDIKEYLLKHNLKFTEEKNLDNILPEVDIVYMTRIQKERITLDEYQNAIGKYMINLSNLALLKPSARILHPLPKVEEIKIPVDVENSDARIAYFRQAENGLYIRMALLAYLIG